jgi:hypothetical protein
MNVAFVAPAGIVTVAGALAAPTGVSRHGQAGSGRLLIDTEAGASDPANTPPAGDRKPERTRSDASAQAA